MALIDLSSVAGNPVVVKAAMSGCTLVGVNLASYKSNIADHAFVFGNNYAGQIFPVLTGNASLRPSSGSQVGQMFIAKDTGTVSIYDGSNWRNT